LVSGLVSVCASVLKGRAVVAATAVEAARNVRRCMDTPEKEREVAATLGHVRPERHMTGA